MTVPHAANQNPTHPPAPTCWICGAPVPQHGVHCTTCNAALTETTSQASALEQEETEAQDARDLLVLQRYGY